ncbi:LmeA family phospholipid-binding protein [Natronospora cellulosivora (SeqCode)]
MKRKRSLWLLLVFIFLVVFLIGIELYLPSIANRILVDIFEQETDVIEDLEINISSFPALKILFGRVDHVSIRSQGLVHDHLFLEKFNLNYRDIVLSRKDFVGVNTYLEAVVTEEALNNYLYEKYPDMGNFSVEINSEQVLLDGEINIMQFRVNFQISGNLVLNNRNQIYFVPNDLQVEQINIPVNLIKTVMEEFAFVIDLQTLDIPIEITELKVESEYIVILGGKEGRGDNE